MDTTDGKGVPGLGLCFASYKAAECLMFHLTKRRAVHIHSISALLLTSSAALAFRFPSRHPSTFASLFPSNNKTPKLSNLRGGKMSSISHENTSAGQDKALEVDAEYPGTAVQRLRSVHARVAQLTREQLNADWPSVRRALLWAGYVHLAMSFSVLI